MPGTYGTSGSAPTSAGTSGSGPSSNGVGAGCGEAARGAGTWVFETDDEPAAALAGGARPSAPITAAPANHGPMYLIVAFMMILLAGGPAMTSVARQHVMSSLLTPIPRCASRNSRRTVAQV